MGLTENDGHEIGGQDIYRSKIDYITMQCAILFKTMTSCNNENIKYMNIKKYQMSLKQYRAFYSVQCRRTYSDT